VGNIAHACARCSQRFPKITRIIYSEHGTNGGGAFLRVFAISRSEDGRSKIHLRAEGSAGRTVPWTAARGIIETFPGSGSPLVMTYPNQNTDDRNQTRRASRSDSRSARASVVTRARDPTCLRGIAFNGEGVMDD